MHVSDNDDVAVNGRWLDSMTRYLVHEERHALLLALTARYPHLLTLDSAGRSYENRDIWVATLTNASTGAASKKPALYVDGNMHGVEVVGAAVALHTIIHCLTTYGVDPAVTRLLDTRVLYILPCVNPDGAERALTTPDFSQGTSRPLQDEIGDNDLVSSDVDGDGHILTMRIPDPLGEWKISLKDPRLMVHRTSLDESGHYYRLYPEGFVHHPTNGPIVNPSTPRKTGPNLNASYLSQWPPLSETPDWFERRPFAEPETLAVVRFIEQHPNICGVVNYHSSGGVFLLPGETPQTPLTAHDHAIYTVLEGLATSATGYPCENDDGASFPTFIRWMWQAFGIWSIVPELWDVYSQVAGQPFDEIPDVVKHDPGDEDTDLAFLAWNDTQLEGQGFIDWHAVDHPQLGTLEIGGWDTKWVDMNPPLQFLEAEAEKMTAFTLKFAALTPLIRIGSIDAEAIGDDHYIVRARIENHGWLPTYLSDWARHHHYDSSVTVEITGGDARIGTAVVDLGHLDGLANASPYASPFKASPGVGRIQNDRMVEWVVRVSSHADMLTVAVSSAKGGTDQRNVPLLRTST